jgi:hypothetical protein
MNKAAQYEVTYEKLSSIFKVKFKSQINNSPIQFERLLQIENLVTNENYYILEISETKHHIKFSDRNSLITEFLDYLEFRIIQNNNDFDNLQIKETELARTGIRFDENQIYKEHESIGFLMEKLEQLKKKFLSLKEKC